MRTPCSAKKVYTLMKVCRLMNFSVLFAAIIHVLPAHAEVYKWVDENGVVQYTNTPPEGEVSSEQVIVDECVSDECLAEQAAASAEAQRRLQSTLRQLEEIDRAKRQKLEDQVAKGEEEEKVTVPAKVGRTPPPILPAAARQQGLF